MNKDKAFKETLGEFIIKFSQLEFGLAYLCSFTDFDLRKQKLALIKQMSNSFENKRKTLSIFIDENFQELKKEWEDINQKIGIINRERRFLAHGFFEYYFPNEEVSTMIIESKKITEKKHTSITIKDLISQVDDIDFELNIQFRSKFIKEVVDNWNNIVLDDNKIVYKVNNKVMSEWKGV